MTRKSSKISRTRTFTNTYIYIYYPTLNQFGQVVTCPASRPKEQFIRRFNNTCTCPASCPLEQFIRRWNNKCTCSATGPRELAPRSTSNSVSVLNVCREGEEVVLNVCREGEEVDLFMQFCQRAQCVQGRRGGRPVHAIPMK